MLKGSGETTGGVPLFSSKSTFTAVKMRGTSFKSMLAGYLRGWLTVALLVSGVVAIVQSKAQYWGITAAIFATIIATYFMFKERNAERLIVREIFGHFFGLGIDPTQVEPRARKSINASIEQVAQRLEELQESGEQDVDPKLVGAISIMMARCSGVSVTNLIDHHGFMPER